MYKSKLISFLLIIQFFSLNLFSQVGVGVYRFLELPASSRISALGSSNVSLRDNDLNFSFLNPSLLTSETSGVFGLNYSRYLADIQFGSVMYGHNFDDKNYAAFGVQYVDLGVFDGRDNVDNPTGSFIAKDMALYLLYARPLNKYFHVGGTLKPIYSAYERYTSVGVAFDAGISYVDSLKLFSAGFVIKNYGFQIKSFRNDEEGQNREPLPLDIQLGVSKKFAHAPFRLSLTLNNLNRWNLAYQSNFIVEQEVSFVDQLFRHAIFSAEFVPSNNFYLAAAYNHRRHQELSIYEFRSMSGFSFGGGVKLYKFHVGFGVSEFQKGLSSYMFSINTSINELIKN